MYVAQVDPSHSLCKLSHSDPPVSVCYVLGLQVCNTTPGQTSSSVGMDSYNMELLLLLYKDLRTCRDRIISQKSNSSEGVSPGGAGQAQDLLIHRDEILHQGAGSWADPFAPV